MADAILGLHVQRYASWMAVGVNKLNNIWNKWVNPGDSDVFPGRKTDLRWWTDSWDRALLYQGNAGADIYMQAMFPKYDRTPWGACYELPNEPECNDLSALAQLNAFTLRCIQLIEARGKGEKLCILNLPEGNPHGGPGKDKGTAAAKLKILAPCVQAAIKGGHYIGLHAYWAPGVEGPEGEYHALRYLFDLEVWGSCGVDVNNAKILLTEYGCDGKIIPGIGSDKGGWKSMYGGSREKYLADCILGEKKLRADTRVEGAMLFTVGYEGEWQSYNHDEETITELYKKTRVLGPIPERGPIVVSTPVIQESPIVIDGRCLQPKEFVAHVADLKFSSWKPTRIFLHHTGIPTLEQWDGKNTILAMKNVYERSQWTDTQGRVHSGWTAGPHIFCGPDGIWLFTPLNEEGVGVKGQDYNSWNVEMVGCYDTWLPYGEVLDNTLCVLNTLCKKIDLDPVKIEFHRDFATKTCPGSAVTKAWIRPLVANWEDPMTEEFNTALRNWVYNNLAPYPAEGLPYNPTFAFPKYATAEMLGAPLCLRESKFKYDGVTYAVAAYVLGIIYCVDGDWGNIQEIYW